MEIYGRFEEGDPAILYTHDKRELMGIIRSPDYLTETLILEMKNKEAEAFSFDDLDGVHLLETPRVFKVISFRRGNFNSGLTDGGGFMDSINNHFNPPKPPPCRQSTRGGGGTYHPIGQPKEGGCCCACGGIGMQYD